MYESGSGARLGLRLLGAPEIVAGSDSLTLSRRKSLGLLSYLALEPGAHGRDSLGALFWPEADQSHSRGNLRSSLFELSRVLGPGWVLLAQDRVSLAPGAIWLDVADYLRRCGADAPSMNAESDQTALASAEAASRMWRGGFMRGFTLADCPDFDDWQFRWSTRLREAQASLLRRLARHYAGIGRWADSEAASSAWIELEPFSEDARREQILALLRMGLPSRASECYAAWERVCRSDLGRSPSAALRALLPKGARLVPLPAERAAAPQAGAGAERPRPTASELGLIGREVELESLCASILSAPGGLHTLTGTGGIGKTSLARAALRAVGADFPGGSWFVDLSEERSAASVPYRIASALGMRELGDSTETMVALVAARLGAARCLLALDNLEQIEGAGAALGALMGRCPGLSLLATSRRALGLEGERVRALEPLGAPPEDARPGVEDIETWPALELVVRRAAAADPRLALDSESIAACACLARRLDGLPLALELAASLMGTLSPLEAVERVERRLELTAVGGEARPGRHSSLRAVVEWSADLLPAEDRRVYASLAVFPADFDAEAAEAVAGGNGVLAALDSLVKVSLLRRFAEAGRCRFAYFRSVRDHAEAALDAAGGRAEVEGRFAAHFLERAEAAAPGLKGPDQVRRLDLALADMGNYEACLRSLVDCGRTEEALRLCLALEWSWSRLGRYATGIRCLEETLRAARPSAPRGALLGSCLRALGWLYFGIGAWHEAHDRYLEALGLLEGGEDLPALTRCLSDLGVLERWLGNRVGGDARCRAAVDIARGIGDPGVLACALVWRYGTLGGMPGTDAQREALEEAARLGRSAREPWIVAHAHQSLGEVCQVQGRCAESLAHFELALSGFAELGDRWMRGWTLEGAAMASCRAGRCDEGRRGLREALGLFLDLGSRGDAAYALGDLAYSYALSGDREAADGLFGAFAAIREELGLESLALPPEPSCGISGERIGRSAAPSLREAADEAASRASPAWRAGVSVCYADLGPLLAGWPASLQRFCNGGRAESGHEGRPSP